MHTGAAHGSAGCARLPSRFQGTFRVSLPRRPAWRCPARERCTCDRRCTALQRLGAERTVTVMGSFSAFKASGRSCVEEREVRREACGQRARARKGEKRHSLHPPFQRSPAQPGCERPAGSSAQIHGLVSRRACRFSSTIWPLQTAMLSADASSPVTNAPSCWFKMAATFASNMAAGTRAQTKRALCTTRCSEAPGRRTVRSGVQSRCSSRNARQSARRDRRRQGCAQLQ